MEIKEIFFDQRKDQKEKGNSTYLLLVKGEPSKDNYFERYIAHAVSLGFTLKKNAKYVAIEYGGIYIIRLYRKNDLKGSFVIRYFPKDFRNNSLMYKPKSSDSKISNNINDEDRLYIAIKMLSEIVNYR
jgi:hypothetical protein